MSFQHHLSLLTSLSRQLHDLSNQLDAHHFSKEQGNEEILPALDESVQPTFSRLLDEHKLLLQTIESDYANEYSQYITGLHTKITLIKKHLSSLPPKTAGFKDQLNLSLSKGLLANLNAVRQTSKTSHPIFWTLDVAEKLKEEYPSL